MIYLLNMMISNSYVKLPWDTTSPTWDLTLSGDQVCDIITQKTPIAESRNHHGDVYIYIHNMYIHIYTYNSNNNKNNSGLVGFF